MFPAHLRKPFITQQTFPRRNKLVHRRDWVRKPQKPQSTLTQLGYVSTPHDHDSPEPYDEGGSEKPKSRKRRKCAGNSSLEKSGRRSTLTQIWDPKLPLEIPDSEDSDEDLDLLVDDGRLEHSLERRPKQSIPPEEAKVVAGQEIQFPTTFSPKRSTRRGAIRSRKKTSSMENPTASGNLSRGVPILRTKTVEDSEPDDDSELDDHPLTADLRKKHPFNRAQIASLDRSLHIAPASDRKGDRITNSQESTPSPERSSVSRDIWLQTGASDSRGDKSTLENGVLQAPSASPSERLGLLRDFASPSRCTEAQTFSVPGQVKWRDAPDSSNNDTENIDYAEGYQESSYDPLNAALERDAARFRGSRTQVDLADSGTPTDTRNFSTGNQHELDTIPEVVPSSQQSEFCGDLPPIPFSQKRCPQAEVAQLQTHIGYRVSNSTSSGFSGCSAEAHSSQWTRRTPLQDPSLPSQVADARADSAVLDSSTRRSSVTHDIKPVLQYERISSYDHQSPPSASVDIGFPYRPPPLSPQPSMTYSPETVSSSPFPTAPGYSVRNGTTQWSRTVNSSLDDFSLPPPPPLYSPRKRDAGTGPKGPATHKTSAADRGCKSAM